MIFFIGKITEVKTGHFIYQSSTSGFNLLMTAYEGRISNLGFPASEIHHIDNIETLNFAERNDVWTRNAVQWIKENPIKYSIFYFLRIPKLYVHDFWAMESHSMVGSTASLMNFLAGDSIEKRQLITELFLRIIASFPYYVAFIFFIYAIWVKRKELATVQATFLVIFLCGTGIICFVNPRQRYHYPLLFTIILYGGWGINLFFEKSKN